jgi:hypothetical protein
MGVTYKNVTIKSTGTALTHTQMDNNFKALADATNTLYYDLSDLSNCTPSSGSVGQSSFGTRYGDLVTLQGSFFPSGFTMPLSGTGTQVGVLTQTNLLPDSLANVVGNAFAYEASSFDCGGAVVNINGEGDIKLFATDETESWSTYMFGFVITYNVN